MQDYICIRKWLATEPQIRGPGLITDQRSRCMMKTWQTRLVTSQCDESIICCTKMKVTTISPLDSRANVKKSDYINIAIEPVASIKRHVVIDKFISSHMNWPES